MIYVHPRAEPFFLTGSKERAILFLHGLTGSPSEVYPTSLCLNQNYGYTVSAPLLPGHGSHPRFLNRTSWQDWFDAALQELSFLLSSYERVWIAGLSMGGLLALHAARWVDGLQGAISINAPLYPRGSAFITVSSMLGFIRPYHPKRNVRQLKELAARGRYTYDVMPVKAFRTMMDLRNQVKEEARAISVPVLIIQGKQDEVVQPISGPHLARMISGSKLISLDHSEHIATMGPDSEYVGQAIAEFAQ